MVPFSTYWPRCAVRGWDRYPWPASGRSRFGVLDSRRPAPRQVDQLDGSFALAVFRHRRSKAASLDLADDSGWFTLFVLATPLRSLGCDCPVVITSFWRLHEPLQIQSSFDHSRGCFRGNRNRTLTRIRPSERNRFNSPPEPGHAPSRSFGAVFRYPHGSFASFLGSFRALRFRSSFEPGSDLRGLAERVVLPSSSGGAHGVLPLRRFVPASGGIASLRSRAHVPFAPRHSTRLIFVGLIALAVSDT